MNWVRAYRRYIPFFIILIAFALVLDWGWSNVKSAISGVVIGFWLSRLWR